MEEKKVKKRTEQNIYLSLYMYIYIYIVAEDLSPAAGPFRSGKGAKVRGAPGAPPAQLETRVRTPLRSVPGREEGAFGEEEGGAPGEGGPGPFQAVKGVSV